MSGSWLVTGASGQLGRRVVELLLEKQVGHVIATTRKPDNLSDLAAKGVEVRLADFDRPESLVDAFRGASRALLVSTDALDAPGKRSAQQRAAVDAFAAAGVQHVVYTSLSKADTSSVNIAPDHHLTEQALAASNLDFTVLRNNLYTDLLLHTLPGAVASGKLIDARANGATAYVTREDCAQAAAGALASSFAGRRTLEISGPEAVTSEQIAAITSELTGKPIGYLSVPVQALIDGMVSHGFPRPLAEVFASFDDAIAKGELSTVSAAVHELSGRKPTSVREFLSAHLAALNPSRLPTAQGLRKRQHISQHARRGDGAACTGALDHQRILVVPIGRKCDQCLGST
ncbi:MAG: SDR family oxidoreductase [Polyangiaceae bacterium]